MTFIGWVNVYRDEDGELVLGGSDIYASEGEANENGAADYADHVGAFVVARHDQLSTPNNADDGGYVSGWNAAIEASASAIKECDRTGREWVNSSLWANIYRAFAPAILRLKK